jgi:hypothetical protein
VNAYSFTYASDRRYKTNITPLSDALSKITSLSGYSFDWKSTGRSDIGVIAQEVEKVFPAIVHTNPDTGMKSVGYGNLVAPLIEAVKEVATRQNKQDEKIADLEKQIQELKALIK